MTVVITRNIEMDVLEIQKSEIKCMVSLDIKDQIEELVEYGRFSTISSAVEIALREMVYRIEDETYARGETRCDIMQVADAFRAKTRRSILRARG